MDDHDYDEDEQFSQPPRPAGEGVRIVGAEEAASRLESGAASGRRPDDELKYGDVPPPPANPVGARPAVRFPLPENADPEDLDLPFRPKPIAPSGDTEMPHWTEPPTGELPITLAQAADEGDTEDDDLGAWASLAARQPRWRDQHADWAEPDYDDLSALADDEMRVGTLDPNRTEHSDLYSFDDPDPTPARGGPAIPVPTTGAYEDDDEGYVEVDPTPSQPRMTSIRSRPTPAPEPEPARPAGGGRDIGTAVGVGVALAAVALFLFKSGPAASMLIVTAVITLAAVELYDVVRRAGYRPATLLGLAATVSLVISAYNTGERAIPLVLSIATIFTLLWYLAGATRARPTINVALTMMGFMWTGFLGSFAALMLRLPNREGIALLLGAILATVANDVGALFVGSQMGRRALAPDISPNKSWEGFFGGMFVSVFVCAVVVSQISPWNLNHAILLGLVVSIVGPLGDLSESMVKRDLGLKDMGSILPGHGGILDRFDALLFVLPAVYYLAQLIGFGALGS